MTDPTPPGFWETLFRGIHALMVAAWLLFDFIVYWLHFDIKNPPVLRGVLVSVGRDPLNRLPGDVVNAGFGAVLAAGAAVLYVDE
jgi:hypothetical protein